MIGESFFHAEHGEIKILERWKPVYTWDGKIYDLTAEAICCEGPMKRKKIMVRWLEVRPNEKLRLWLLGD